MLYSGQGLCESGTYSRKLWHGDATLETPVHHKHRAHWFAQSFTDLFTPQDNLVWPVHQLSCFWELEGNQTTWYGQPKCTVAVYVGNIIIYFRFVCKVLIKDTPINIEGNLPYAFADYSMNYLQEAVHFCLMFREFSSKHIEYKSIDNGDKEET